MPLGSQLLQPFDSSSPGTSGPAKGVPSEQLLPHGLCVRTLKKAWSEQKTMVRKRRRKKRRSAGGRRGGEGVGELSGEAGEAKGGGGSRKTPRPVSFSLNLSPRACPLPGFATAGPTAKRGLISNPVFKEQVEVRATATKGHWQNSPFPSFPDGLSCACGGSRHPRIGPHSPRGGP